MTDNEPRLYGTGTVHGAGFRDGFPEAPTDPTPTPREAVIRALHEAGAWCGQCDYESDSPCEECDVVLAKYADRTLAALAATGDAPLSAWDEGTLRRWLAEAPPPEGVDAEQWLESVRWSAKNALTAYTTLAAQLAAVRAEREGYRVALQTRQVTSRTRFIDWTVLLQGVS